jgi:hypothetical protein
MSRRGSEQRALTRMERHLQAGDQRLESLFNSFARLAEHEPMPAIERIRRRRWRAYPHLVVVIVLAVIISGITTAVVTIPGSSCGTGRAGVVGVIPVPARESAAGASQQNTAGASLPRPAC